MVEAAAPSRGESENESVPLGKGTVEYASDGMIVVVRNGCGVGHGDSVETKMQEWRSEGEATEELLCNVSLFPVYNTGLSRSFRVLRDQRKISASLMT